MDFENNNDMGQDFQVQNIEEAEDFLKAFNDAVNGSDFEEPIPNEEVDEVKPQLEEVDDAQNEEDDDNYDEGVVEDSFSSEPVQNVYNDTPEEDFSEQKTPGKKRSYKAAYQKEKAQNNLLYSRINELSLKLQQQQEALLKLHSQAQVVPEKAPTPVYEEPEDINWDALPQNVKEVMEDYPGLKDVVDFVTKYRTTNVQKRFQNELESKINPLQQQLFNAELQRARATVSAVHPDAGQILGSPDLQHWIQSLPPMIRRGAVSVYQQGSVEEIIQLLTEYKQARGLNANNQRPSSTSSVSLPPQASSSQGRQPRPSGHRGSTQLVDDDMDTLVNKVRAAQTVPSRRNPVSLERQPQSFEDAFAAEVTAYERSRKRGR